MIILIEGENFLLEDQLITDQKRREKLIELIQQNDDRRRIEYINEIAKNRIVEAIPVIKKLFFNESNLNIKFNLGTAWLRLEGNKTGALAQLSVMFQKHQLQKSQRALIYNYWMLFLDYREALVTNPIPTLIQALVNPMDQYNKYRSAVFLLSFEGGKILPLIEKEWKKGNQTIKRRILRVLPHFDKKQVAKLQLLKEALIDSNWKIRRDALYIIGKLDDLGKKFLPYITKLMKDDRYQVKKEAIWALGRTGVSDKSFVPLLICELNNSDRNIVVEAIRVLGDLDIEHDQVIQNIRLFLENEDKKIRFEAARTFVKIGKKAAYETFYILELLKKEKLIHIRKSFIKFLASVHGLHGEKIDSILKSLLNEEIIHQWEFDFYLEQFTVRA